MRRTWLVLAAMAAGCGAGAAGPDDTVAPHDSGAVDVVDALADTVTTDTAQADAAVRDTVVPADATTPGDTALDGDTSSADTMRDSAQDTGVLDAAGDPWSSLTGDALRTALQTATETGHTPLGYTGGRDAMFARGGIDDDGGRVTCIYTGRTVETNGSRTPGDGCQLADGTPTSCAFNTEHTWARFYLRLYLTEGSAAYDDAEGDIHHLFPCDSRVNTARWHFAFADTDCDDAGNCALDEGSVIGLRPGVDGNADCPTGNLDLDDDCVTMVRPERRGDIARAQFYMAVRYNMPIDDTLSEADMRKWHAADPPDAYEQRRNAAIEAAQGNRNPFVDWPELVERITDF